MMAAVIGMIGCLHRGISRMQAERLLLAAKQDGSYLIRESETISGAYTLCVLWLGCVYRYRILRDCGGLLSVECVAGTKHPKFTDLAQLIQRYAERGENNGLVGSLLHPINVNPYNDIIGYCYAGDKLKMDTAPVVEPKSPGVTQPVCHPKTIFHANECHDTIVQSSSPVDAGSEILHKHRTKLAMQLDAHVIAMHLYQRDMLTLKQLQSVQSLRRLPVKAAEMLLNIIMIKPDAVYLCFLAVLKLTEQQHIYEALVKDGYKDYDEQTSHTRVIQAHYVFLVEKLDVKFSGLVNQLYSDKVLNAVEIDDISAEVSSFRANEKLLSMLSRKTPQQFQLFLDALDIHGQQHIHDVVTGTPTSPNVLVTEGQNAPQPAPAEPKEVAKTQSPERPVDIVNQEDFQSRPQVIDTFSKADDVNNNELYVLREQEADQVDVYSTYL